MGYLTGKKLLDRARAAGLEHLADILDQVSADPRAWPGPCTISVKPAHREAVRNLIYALLHQHGLKDGFTVKAQGDYALVMEMRNRAAQDWQATATFSPLAPGSCPTGPASCPQDVDEQGMTEVGRRDADLLADIFPELRPSGPAKTSQGTEPGTEPGTEEK